MSRSAFRTCVLTITLFVVGSLGAPTSHSEETSWRAALSEKLDKRITVEFSDTPLSDIAEFLSDSTDAVVLLDAKALDAIGLAGDVTVSKSLRSVHLRTALHLLLRDLDLTYVLQRGAIVITTPEEAESQLETRIVEAKDLANQSAEEGEEYDELIDLIKSTVQQSSWDDCGGPGAIDAFQGTLVISQPLEMQRNIRDLLTGLRRAKELTDKGDTNKQPRPVVVHCAQDQREKVYAALKAKGNYSFRDVPLREVIEYIESQHETEIEMDLRALDSIGLDADVPVTHKSRGLALRDVLDHILPQLDLTWTIFDDVVMITTPEEEEKIITTRVYPVDDLVRHDDDQVWLQEHDSDQLMDLVVSSVVPETWEDVGGPASMRYSTPCKSLVIAQTEASHQELETLFRNLRNKVKLADAVPADNTILRLRVYRIEFASNMEKRDASAPNTPQPDGQGGQGGQGGNSEQTLNQLGLGGLGGVSDYVPAFQKDDLVEVIRDLAAPDTWSQNDVYIRATSGRLIIRQTDAVHGEVKTLLRRLGVRYDLLKQTSPALNDPFGGGSFIGGGAF